MTFTTFQKVLLNAIITGSISMLALLVSGQGNITKPAIVAAILAGFLSFFIELKKELDQSQLPPTNPLMLIGFV